VKVSNKKHITPKQVLGRLGSPNKLTRYAFYGVVFSFPWETLDIGLGGKFSVARILGMFFFGVALLQPKICFRVPPKPFWLFLLYLFFYALVSTGLDAAYDRPNFMKGFTIVQLLVLFWLSYNVMHDERVRKGFLLAFIGGCLSLAIGGLFLEGVTEGVKAGGIDDERMVFLGADPNTTGATFALGLIAVLGLAYGREDFHLKTRLFAWLPFFILASFMIRTGSRGAALSLVIGVVFFLVKGGNIRSKVGLGIVVLIGLMTLVGLTLQSDMLVKRFEMTMGEGNIAGRDVIYIEVASMVNEKPLLGWGPLRYRFELANRVGKYGQERDTHNMYLKTLVEVGILGAIPYFLGIGLCVWAAWKARHGYEGSLPISMLVTLVMINMTLTWDNRKIFWIILAYGLASYTHIHSQRNPKVEPYSGQRLGVGFSKSPQKSGSQIVVGQ